MRVAADIPPATPPTMTTFTIYLLDVAVDYTPGGI